jgi:hypothetical protein
VTRDFFFGPESRIDSRVDFQRFNVACARKTEAGKSGPIDMPLEIKQDFPYVIRLYRHLRCNPTDFVGSGLSMGRSQVSWHTQDCLKRIAAVIRNPVSE